MSRKRDLSSDISIDERIAELSESEHGYLAVALYMMAIPQADDWGRLPGSAREFKMLVCPGFDTPRAEIDAAMGEIARMGLWDRYEVGGKHCIAFPPDTWFKRQSYINSGKRTSDKGSLYPANQQFLEYSASQTAEKPEDEASNGKERQKTARNGKERHYARASPSPSPSPTLSPSEKKEPPPTSPQPAPTDGDGQDCSVRLSEQLKSLGLRPEDISEVLAKADCAAVEKQIEWLPARMATSRTPVNYPSLLLKTACLKTYDVTDAMRKWRKTEDEKCQKEEQNTRSQQQSEQSKADREAQKLRSAALWAILAPDEQAEIEQDAKADFRRQFPVHSKRLDAGTLGAGPTQLLLAIRDGLVARRAGREKAEA